MAVVETPISSPNPLSVAGLVLTGFSVFAGLLLLFVVPSSCSFVASVGLVILFFTLVAGLIMLLIAGIRRRRNSN